jgi:aldehyde dehydrogenase (NAD+)
VVFADADLDAAVPVLVNAIVQNAGQTCSAGSRVLIERAIYEPLLERLGHAFEALRVGPAAMDLDLGPLIRQSQQQRVWDFLSDAQVAGIPLVAQGTVVDEAPDTGFYQAPALLRDVPVDHRLAQEEIFGPVLAAMPFEGEDEAAYLANATPFGLVAGIWTRDGARQFRMARRIASGQVFINNYGAAGGVELPFGGVKSSGYGREKGFEALYGFTTLKTVAIRHGAPPGGGGGAAGGRPTAGLCSPLSRFSRCPCLCRPPPPAPPNTSAASLTRGSRARTACGTSKASCTTARPRTAPRCATPSASAAPASPCTTCGCA